MRPDGRRPDQLRPLEIITGFQKHAEGSALIKLGRHPRAVRRERRGRRAAVPGRQGPGLAHRRVRDAAALDPHPHQARSRRPRQGDPAADRPGAARRGRPRRPRRAHDRGRLRRAPGRRRHARRVDHRRLGRVRARDPASWSKRGDLPDARALRPPVAAVSVGIVGGEVVLDLPYVEDSKADVDMNVVVTAAGKLIEVQGTAEHATFARAPARRDARSRARRDRAARHGAARGRRARMSVER